MSRCHTGAGRAGEGRAGQGPGPRPGAGAKAGDSAPALPPLLSYGPPRRPLASLELEQAAEAAAAEAAAAAPGRPLGVGVSGRLRSGSSSLQHLPRPRSHHLDLARLPLPLLLFGGQEAVPAVTRDRGARAADCIIIGRWGRSPQRHHARRSNRLAVLLWFPPTFAALAPPHGAGALQQPRPLG